MDRTGRGRSGTSRRRAFARRFVVLWVVTLCLVAGAGFSHAQQGNGNGNGNGNAKPMGPASMKLRLPNQINLEPVRLNELIPGGATVIAFNGTDPGMPLHNVSILREQRNLWRMNLHGQGGTAPAMLVSYDLTAANGLAGHLSSTSTPSATIQVTLEEIPPTFRITPGVVQARGGVRFHMDVTSATTAGGYSGTLLVTVNTL